MKKIGIIKLGTLDLKLNIAQILPNQTFIMLEEYKESTRIIEDFENDIPIQQARLNEILSTLNNFKAICDSKEVEEVICYNDLEYTKLKNEHSFFELITSKTGYRFSPLLDKEKIDYVYTTVISSLDITKGLFLHVGEHKSYLVQYNRRMIINQIVFPFGFASHLKTLRESSPEQRHNFIQKEVNKVLDKEENAWLKDMPDETSVVLQGEVSKNISKLVRKNTRYPFDKDQNFTTTKSMVVKVCDTLIEMPFDDKKKLKGTSTRADTMVMGSYIIKCILERLPFLAENERIESKVSVLVDNTEENEEIQETETKKVNQIIICEYDICYGLMFKMVNNTTFSTRPSDVLEFSLSAINAYYNSEKNADYVSKLAVIIFKQLKVLHRLGRNYLTVLKIASKLYDAGTRINPSDPDKFAYYALMNSPIYGVQHREIVLASFVLMCQNNDNFLLTEWAKYKPIILEEGQDELELKLACQRLAVILKLARAFDKYSNSKVIDITCDNLGDCVIMKTTTTTQSVLEIREAKKLDAEFKKVFNNKKIEIL